MNLLTGRKSLVNFSSPGNVLGWVLDAQDAPRAALSMDIEKRRWWFSYLPSAESREWSTVAQWDEQLRDVVIPLAFDPANLSQMFVASNRGRDAMALFEFNPLACKVSGVRSTYLNFISASARSSCNPRQQQRKPDAGSSVTADAASRSYFGVNRIAPSSRITSPLSISFVTMHCTSLA